MRHLERARDSDPKLEGMREVLTAWKAAIGSEKITTGTLIAMATKVSQDPLGANSFDYPALHDARAHRRRQGRQDRHEYPRKLARVDKDKPVNGLVLKKVKIDGYSRWHVTADSKPSPTPDPRPTASATPPASEADLLDDPTPPPDDPESYGRTPTARRSIPTLGVRCTNPRAPPRIEPTARQARRSHSTDRLPWRSTRNRTMTTKRKINTEPEAKITGTVEEIAARIVALRDASQSGSDEAYALKRRLAHEFGRRNGWERIAGDAFNLIDILAQTYHCPDLIHPSPQSDHANYYRLNGRAVTIAVHLYDCDDERRAEIETYAAVRGLRATFPDFSKLVNPGATSLWSMRQRTRTRRRPSPTTTTTKKCSADRSKGVAVELRRPLERILAGGQIGRRINPVPPGDHLAPPHHYQDRHVHLARRFSRRLNLAGRHGKDAALHALRHHGAIYGQGCRPPLPQSQQESYGIRTNQASCTELLWSASQNMATAAPV